MRNVRKGVDRWCGMVFNNVMTNTETAASPIPFINTTIAFTFKVEDIRPVDFQTGKRVALPRDEMFECECCGRRIVKLHHMANGMRVGSECEGYLSTPVYRRGRKNAAADRLLAEKEAGR